MLLESATGQIDPFAGTFVYRCSVPVSIESISWPQNCAVLHQNNIDNEILLEVLTAKPLTTPKLEDSESETRLHLAQVEAKLDLLLNWMGRMVAQQRSMPATRNIEINAYAIKFAAPNDLSISGQQYFQVQLFLSEIYPEPLNLYAQVIAITQAVDTNDLTLRFIGCSEKLVDLLERFIFKRHRHDVAKLRKLSTGVEDPNI